MTLSLLRRFCVVSFLLLLGAAPALAGDWVISKVTGEAWIASQHEEPVRAAAGMTIPDEATFSTGHNARAQLERGAEIILVSPNTVISPQSSSFFGTTTSILQQTGQIELEVEKRNVKHFSVRTPLLAAVVKGTHFTVSVSTQSASVQVARGLVEVSDLRSGASADVSPGQKASVSNKDGRGLQISKNNEPEIRKGRSKDSEQEGGPKGQTGGKTGTGNSPGGGKNSDATGGNTGGAGSGNGSSGSGGAGSNAGGGNGGGKGGGSGGSSGNNSGGNSSGGGSGTGNSGNGGGNGTGNGNGNGGGNGNGNGNGVGNGGATGNGGGSGNGGNGNGKGGGAGSGDGSGPGNSGNGGGNGVGNGGGAGNGGGNGNGNAGGNGKGR